MMKLLQQNIEFWGENIPWLSALREKGRMAFAYSGVPQKKDEAWKYSYFAEKSLDNPQIDITPHICDGHCDEQDILPFDCYQVKYCNGKVTHIDNKIPDNIIVKPLYAAVADNDVKKYLNKSFTMENFPFAALNTAFLDEGLFIAITSGTILDKPLYIHYHQHANNNRLCNIRNIVVAEKDSMATLIEHFDSDDNAQYFNNVVNEFYLHQNSKIERYKLQKEAVLAHHICLNSVQVKSGAQYKSFCANGECMLSREESYINLLQERAEAEVNGIYLLKQKGVSDITTNIRHMAPHTFSQQLVKGVIEGKAKGVFQGQIHIAPNAQQTEGYQRHNALLLSDDAEVDCKPELEIFADDVKCSHGSTCGDINAEQLFYMQSRGIPAEKARKILIDAYLEEVLHKVSATEIFAWLKSVF